MREKSGEDCNKGERLNNNLLMKTHMKCGDERDRRANTIQIYYRERDSETESLRGRNYLYRIETENTKNSKKN